MRRPLHALRCRVLPPLTSPAPCSRKLRVDHKEMFSAPKPKKGEEEQPLPPKIDVLAQALHTPRNCPPTPLLTSHPPPNLPPPS